VSISATGALSLCQILPALTVPWRRVDRSAYYIAR
jgi:hypothetical protein